MANPNALPVLSAAFALAAVGCRSYAAWARTLASRARISAVRARQAATRPALGSQHASSAPSGAIASLGQGEEPNPLTWQTLLRAPSRFTSQSFSLSSISRFTRSTTLICPAGSYRSTPGARSQLECDACPSGSACVAGSSSQVPCEPGSFSTGSAGVCTGCSPGSYQDAAGASSCKQCPSGQYCLARAASSLECVPGTFSAAEGSSACAACAAGTYQALGGATSCDPCPIGSYCGASTSAPAACAAL